MRRLSPAILSVPLLTLALLLGAGGCKQARKEPAPTSHVTPEYQRASEAIDKQIPNTPGLPGSAGVNGIKKALQANEAAQERRDHRAGSQGAEAP